MTEPSLWLTVRPAACRIMVLAVLLGVVADADARGGRRGGGGSRSNATSRSESSSPTIHIRTSGSSSSDGSPESDPSSGGRKAGARVSAKFEPPLTPEEAARQAALLAAYERRQAEEAAARKASVEKAEAARLTAEQAAAARQAAEDKARADKLAADERQKQQEEATVAADVDRVLKRAKADFPVLNTPAGGPVLERIVERQRALAATGMYPSIAMVQAVADQDYLLRPVAWPPAVAPAAPAATRATGPAEIGGCRWVTPIEWACK